jgi:putative transposase
MDLQDAGATAVRYLIRDRDSKYPTAFDAVLADSGIPAITTGILMPRTNAIMERWIRTCRTELLDRTLIHNQRHLLHALHEYEDFYNQHRPHRALHAAALPTPIAEPHALQHLNIRQQDRLGDILRRLTSTGAIIGAYRAMEQAALASPAEKEHSVRAMMTTCAEEVTCGH